MLILLLVAIGANSDHLDPCDPPTVYQYQHPPEEGFGDVPDGAVDAVHQLHLPDPGVVPGKHQDLEDLIAEEWNAFKVNPEKLG